MATKIVTKNSSTASAVPTASDLVQGELAVNVADKRLFTEDNGGAIVELGVNPAAEITANGGIALPDSQKATFGTGDDLQIYHDGSNSYIQDQGLSGTGNLILAGADVEITTFGGNKYFQGASNIARLYHTNNEKLATTATGIDVTGSVTADGAVNSTYFTGGSSSIAGRQLTLSCEDGTGGQDNATHRLTVPSGYGSFATSVGGSERMRIDSSGNVGINQSNPTQKLHVSGNAIITGLTRIGDGTASSPSYQFVSDTDTGMYRASSNVLGFSTGGSERMRIDSSGRVGIGTSSPISKMQVSGANNGDVFYLTSSDVEDDRGLMFSNSSNGLIWDLDAKGASSSFGQMTFSTNGSERMRIDSSGNLLVGTTSTGFVNDNGFTKEGASVVQRHNTSQPSGTKYTYFTYNTSSIGSISQSGTTAVLYNTSSDQRLKENIADADDAGSKIDAIQVRKYDWKADGSHQDYGMIAQELQAVAPEAVSGDADSEEMMGVDYSKLVPMMLKEIQSLRNRVAQLEG